MYDQRHVIQRQVIELQVQGSDEAWELQEEIGRIFSQQLLPLIDRTCSELSAPDRLYRIDTLELDLGFLDPGQLESDLVAKVEAALPGALAQEIEALDLSGEGQADQKPRAGSQLELFAFVARTGNLPWWAEASRPQLLEENLQGLIEDAADPLRFLMRELILERRPMQRIAAHYDDDQLMQLAALLAPAWREVLAQDIAPCIEALAMSENAERRSPARYRRIFWEQLLIVAAQQRERQALAVSAYRELLPRLAIRLGSDYAVLLEEMRRLFKDVVTISPALRQAVETLYAESPAAAVEQGKRAARLLAELHSLTSRLPPAIRQEWRRALERWQSQVSKGKGVPETAVETILQLLTQDKALLAAAPDGLPVDDIEELEQALHMLLGRISKEATKAAASEAARGEQPPAPRQTPVETAVPQAIPPTMPQELSLELDFDEVDALYIGNAGLVILWPFLENFFAGLDLVKKGRFVDDKARQRAVGLLQFLAAGVDENEFPEFLLPLNKILCGLEVDDLWEFDSPLTDEEIEEGENLLQAVIAQAPVLGDMPVDGLRGTFLLREGALRGGDDAWLLQVERKTYDIVLERFPWSWTWIKLPWMAVPLQVEW